MNLELEWKKQKVLDTLIVLEEWKIWELAKPLAIFIKNSENINEELLDAVLQIISNAILETKDKVKLAKLEKAKSTLEWMLKEERDDRKKEEDEADSMLENIDF